MTGPRVEKLVLVAPNPAGSPVPAEVLEYLIEDDAVVDELAAAAAGVADSNAAAADCALLLGDEATDKPLLAEKGVGIMRELWRCRAGQMRLAVLRIITEFMVTLRRVICDNC